MDHSVDGVLRLRDVKDLPRITARNGYRWDSNPGVPLGTTSLPHRDSCGTASALEANVTKAMSNS